MTGFPVTDDDINRLRIKILRALAAARFPREAIGVVAKNNELTVDDVKSLVAQYGWPNAAQMAEAALELAGGGTPTPAPRPHVDIRPEAAPPPRPTSSVSTTTSPMPPAQALHRTDAVLDRAEKSDKARTRRLAIKVREQLAELLGLVNAEEEEQKVTARAAAEKGRLRAEVEQLEAELAKKRAELKGSKPKPAKAAERPPAQHNPKEIRAWAADNNVECSPYGRVPSEVYAAYTAALTEAGS